MAKTKIEWTEMSWNPVAGCTKVSEGCQNCYAEKMAYRLACLGAAQRPKGTFSETPLWKKYASVLDWGANIGKWNGEIYCDEKALDIPLHWRKPRRIFVCSMSDLFHESVPFEFIDKVMAVIALCPQHNFQVLTKRLKKMAEYFKDEYPLRARIRDAMMEIKGQHTIYKSYPLPNLWLGVSVELPKYEQRIIDLLQIPAAHRFVSGEPLLEAIDFQPYCDDIGWFILGCESGPRRRVISLNDFMETFNSIDNPTTKVFVKQVSINGKVSHNPAEWPEDLRYRELPY